MGAARFPTRGYSEGTGHRATREAMSLPCMLAAFTWPGVLHCGLLDTRLVAETKRRKYLKATGQRLLERLQGVRIALGQSFGLDGQRLTVFPLQGQRAGSATSTLLAVARANS